MDLVEKDFDVNLALKLAKFVHNQCDNVPHDIGIKLAEIVDCYLKSIASEKDEANK